MRERPSGAIAWARRRAGAWLLLAAASCSTTTGPGASSKTTPPPAPGRIVFESRDGGSVELGGIRIDRCEMDSGRLLLLARAVGCAAVSSELRVVVKRRSSHENGIDTVLFDSVKHPEWKAPVVSEGPPATKLSVPFSRPPELSPVLLIALSGRCAGGVDRAQGDWTCRL